MSNSNLAVVDGFIERQLELREEGNMPPDVVKEIQKDVDARMNDAERLRLATIEAIRSRKTLTVNDLATLSDEFKFLGDMEVRELLDGNGASFATVRRGRGRPKGSPTKSKRLKPEDLERIAKDLKKALPSEKEKGITKSELFKKAGEPGITDAYWNKLRKMEPLKGLKQSSPRGSKVTYWLP
jgi:hypothetical protein